VLGIYQLWNSSSAAHPTPIAPISVPLAMVDPPGTAL
jgi:hypothetical protein